MYKVARLVQNIPALGGKLLCKWLRMFSGRLEVLPQLMRPWNGMLRGYASSVKDVLLEVCGVTFQGDYE
eukprot:8105165-Heterocapsa_arctica.AAC.1